MSCYGDEYLKNKNPGKEHTGYLLKQTDTKTVTDRETDDRDVISMHQSAHWSDLEI